MQVHALDLMSKSVDGISVLHFALKKKKIVAVVRGIWSYLFLPQSINFHLSQKEMVSREPVQQELWPGLL